MTLMSLPKHKHIIIRNINEVKMRYIITATEEQLRSFGISSDISGLDGELIKKFPSGWYTLNVEHKVHDITFNNDFDIPKTFLTIKRGCVDLRTCKKGDILISALGAKLKYLKPTKNDNDNYDHLVEYLDSDSGNGTRTHDGYVFRKNRIPKTDHDIVEIIHQK